MADLVTQFDTNMFPKETAAFSTPPDRDGTNALLGPDANGNGGVYTGGGDKTVTLVDNVRDDNYYTFPAAPTYIAGFFSTQFNELFDRNVMTIDAFDWAHRTGANPPNEPTSDVCTSRPARPRLYEGTFAHEWQHLLHYYTDPFETTWMNEGLSDFAQTLVGYVDGTKTHRPGGDDSHINCFQGLGHRRRHRPTPTRETAVVPQNSLNIWGEGAPAAVLADYGNAYSLMLFLFDRYGTDFMSALHRDGDLQGLASLQAQLDAEGASDVYKVLHDFQTMNLVDRIVGDRSIVIVLGAPQERVTTASLNALVNLANPQSNARPGRPQRRGLRGAAERRGQASRARNLRSVKFDGAKTLPPIPLAWTIGHQRPGPRRQPGAVVGQRQQHRRRRGHPGHGAGGRPDAALPRQVRRGVRLRLRLRGRLHRRWQELHDHPG